METNYISKGKLDQHQVPMLTSAGPPPETPGPVRCVLCLRSLSKRPPLLEKMPLLISERNTALEPFRLHIWLV